jgi:hypothetical protein
LRRCSAAFSPECRRSNLTKRPSQF